MADWLAEARSRIPITRSKVYLDNAGAGPLPSDVVEAMRNFLEKWSLMGEPWPEALGHIIESRAMFAELIGARAEEVAAVPGVSYGFNSFLASLKAGKGNAVAGAYNFPTTYYALHAARSRGLLSEVRIARGDGSRTPLEEYERLIDEETVLVVADHVSWITGYMEDLRAVADIAHSKGAILVSDAFHSVGVVPVDVKSLRVDVLLAGSYKWLMGPHGAGFVYVERNLLEELEPMLAGWMSAEDSVIERFERGERLFERPFDITGFTRAKDAKVLEWGTWPVIAFEGVIASMKFLNEFGAPEKYESHTRRLVERLMDGLMDMGYEVVTPRDSKASIVVFKHRKPYELASILSRDGYIVSPRPGTIRVSPHFYNTIDEIESFLEALGRLDGASMPR